MIKAKEQRTELKLAQINLEIAEKMWPSQRSFSTNSKRILQFKY
jgi:hypothetical protein